MKEQINNLNPDISIVMPCLDEEKTIASCITKTKDAVKKFNLNAEIVIADNGSTDNSIKIAKKLGARVIYQPQKGYGNAYHKGIAEARGKYIIIGDSDNTYDFNQINDFIKPLQNGHDFVIGNRFAYPMEKKAMSFSHRYIGNPVLSGILRKMFKVNIKDAHCGMRAFTKEAYQKLNLQTTGMEYASEMVIRAGKENLKTLEIPIHYGVRLGKSKLDTFFDGWRHLRFMLLYSPNYLFLIPGFTLFILGLIFLIRMMFGPIQIGLRTIDIHPMFLGALLAIAGYQIFSFGIFSKLYTFNRGLEKEGKTVQCFKKYFSLEKTIYIGLLLILIGTILAGYIIWKWKNAQFGNLFEIRKTLVSLTLIIIGIQTIFSAFFFSIIEIKSLKDNN